MENEPSKAQIDATYWADYESGGAPTESNSVPVLKIVFSEIARVLKETYHTLIIKRRK